MNFNRILSRNKEEERFYYLQEHTPDNLATSLLQWIPRFKQNVIILCIGTDRSTGDALGPLVGTFLCEQKPSSLSVYGTLDHPVHAKNIHEHLTTIQQNHFNPFIIAVDACLGKYSSIGTIIAGQGSLRPGAAVKKDLPEVGNVFISGVVNISGYMEYFVLQSTRLSIVMNMAKKIACSLKQVDDRLTNRRYTKKHKKSAR
ncbi:putative sporulation protein YyaC [Melghiribacillus thermohalophilus]|uniref:Putative sporulation protein YyaC n=1 Tax=Melghiribacillus thermohalophilus TaxID=1324956 RepID=A0A4R3N5W6_9BACI|nr:spore protease YyaC [Melghiribacillus thermohalophilus]TCT24618.1 putative sporulation protein YyaC [Melghiribacillus thermohalophilus]